MELEVPVEGSQQLIPCSPHLITFPEECEIVLLMPIGFFSLSMVYNNLVWWKYMVLRLECSPKHNR